MIGIIMGSASDMKVMEAAITFLKNRNIPYEVTVVSAHRTPERMLAYAARAADRNIQIIIAGAGGAAHLPGMIASATNLPVIGVPILSSNSLQGWDSLLSIAQMPAGVPVATMGVNGALNAAVMACKILALNDKKIFQKLERYRIELKDKVHEMAEEIAQKHPNFYDTFSSNEEKHSPKTITYKSAGVDKEEGYKTVHTIKKAVEKTHNKNVLNTLGGFGALFEIKDYKNPVLVSSTDGVGTKIKLALDTEHYQTIGIDCFAMCVNDILCHGAKPLFFLDYMACGKLEAKVAAEIVKGMAKACAQSDTALIGGETAEMPGIYQINDYDVAGFCVGIVEKENIITVEKVSNGDIAIAIPSSGFHSNGFSLIRKIYAENNESSKGKVLLETLLTPTRIYTCEISTILQHFIPSGIAHITGGGIIENLPRILPNGLGIHIKSRIIKTPSIMKNLQEKANIGSNEMFGTFNMGVGMIIIVKPEFKQQTLSLIKDAYPIGSIEKSSQKIQMDYA